MRRIGSLIAGVVLALTACAGGFAAAVPLTPEPVRLLDGDFALSAILFRPEGSGPFPAVVALHGCGGFSKDRFERRYRDWAQRLVDRGFAIVFPDSYGSRGLGSQCRVRDRAVRPEREQVEDAQAARRWLQAQPWVKPDRVSLLGWSTGGTGVLWAIRPQAKRDRGKPDFRSAVAFYPNCRGADAVAWSARVPVLVLIGRNDDLASAAACEQMVAGARGRSARARLTIYPGAPHDFDVPNRPVQMRTDLVSSTDGTASVQSGTDPAARADALLRVPDWLAR